MSLTQQNPPHINTSHPVPLQQPLSEALHQIQTRAAQHANASHLQITFVRLCPGCRSIAEASATADNGTIHLRCLRCTTKTTITRTPHSGGVA